MQSTHPLHTAFTHFSSLITAVVGISLCGYFGGAPINQFPGVVIGFEETSYTVTEGETVMICVTTFSGERVVPSLSLRLKLHFDNARQSTSNVLRRIPINAHFLCSSQVFESIPGTCVH